MTEHEYFEFYLQTVWKVYQKLNCELHANKGSGTLYGEVPSFFKEHRMDEFQKLTSYEEFHDSVMKSKDRYLVDTDYSHIKNGLFQSLRQLSEPEFLKEYINEIIFNSPEVYSNAFIENRFGYPMHQGTSEYLSKLLPKMSYENTLCYFTQINTWYALNSKLCLDIPRLKDLTYCKELIYTSAKICSDKDSQNINSTEYSYVISHLLDNYSDKELKTFDFLSEINIFLSSKNKPKDIIVNQDDVFFTTRISVDCEHAKNIFYYKSCNAGNYAALVDEIMEELKNDPENNILDVNVIHKYDKSHPGRNKNYKISEVFIDTKEYDPNLKPRVSYLINKYIEDYIEKLKDSPDGFEPKKFTQNWLMQENLKLELETNQQSKTKARKI